MAHYLSVLLSLFLINTNLVAQTFRPDTAFISSAKESARDVYSQVMKNQIQLYNGGDYVEYKSLIDEHPYFITKDWVMGSIQYQNEWHHNVPLLYNIHTDDIITKQSSIMIQLVRDKIQSFSINGHEFFMIKQKDLPNGFYDQLCKGKIKLYARRIKDFKETISRSELQRSFIEKSKYYLYKEGHFYPIKNKKSVLNVLSDRKQELNQFSHQNHLRFRENREIAIIKMIEFYNWN